MSIVNISDLSPKVREAFLLSEPAIRTWDVSAHEILEDCIKNSKRIWQDVSRGAIIYEILCGILVALIFDIFPGIILWFERQGHFQGKTSLYMVSFMVVANTAVAIHRKLKIRKMKRQGAEWRIRINALIDKTAELSFSERQQLYATMLALGVEVQQAKLHGAQIKAAYRDGWWDGFVIGG